MMGFIRRRLSYVNVAMTVALVFAMSGGAFAVAGKGTAGQATIAAKKKKSKAKVLRGPAGPKGATGPAGPAGPSGPAGPAGPAGAKGETGPAGAVGPQGPAGPEGPAGPAGKNGTNGKEGSPWTAGGTLPSGSAETGVWSLTQLKAEENFGGVKIPISFTIPLAAPLDENHVHVIEPEAGLPGKEAVPAGCSLTRSGETVEVEAEAGNLCVYTQYSEGLSGMALVNFEGGGNLGAGKTGAILGAGHGENGATAEGYWVVRAP